jgi:phenylacetate-coenzyme A ligase PaaK-like adenylate-forming protein
MQPATLEMEQEEQNNWQLKPESSRLAFLYDSYIKNEFLSEDERIKKENHIVANLVQYATDYVPYYKNLFIKNSIDPQRIKSVTDLEQLSTLNRKIIRTNFNELQSLKLPKGDEWAGYNVTSGHSSPVTQFRLTRFARFTSQHIIQRHYRWLKWNPKLKMGFIHGPRAITSNADPSSNDWPGIGKHFETGPLSVISVDQSLDEIAEWLDKEKPGYLRAWPTVMEQLALYSPETNHTSLKGLRIVGGMLTHAMEKRINATFSVPTLIGYGLDESGWLAGRCLEGKRYHAYSENCILEIVDDNNKACKPGQYGSILVTTLNNPGTPLLRHETGDTARVSDGPCPCGRTLPSFEGPIFPKVNFRQLDESSRHVVHKMLDAVSELPQELSNKLNKYQIRRNSQTEYTLLLNTEIIESLEKHLTSRWNELLADVFLKGIKLTLKQVNDIPKEIGGKVVNYTDDTLVVNNN